MPTQSEFSIRKFQFALLIAVLSAFIAFGLLYRTSSQGDLSETYPKGFRGGACTIESEMLIIGYSGYYLPEDYQSPDDLRSPHVPVQCGKIPEPASLNISIDLLYPESARDFSLALRLVKLEADEKENQREQPIMSVPARQHPSGVITVAFKLSELGHYVLYLEGKNTEDADLQVKIPMQVGLDWKNHLRNALSPLLKKD
ncbi:MAG: hypothetical protein HRU77_00245 [Gammaproteobacteria bacterium]|nr:MAG: hypothetical protein HRU77_00245 [Gammaproteobacteria bacterium]